MYSPQLGRFLSRDPRVAGQPDIFYDNNWFGYAMTRMKNLYGYANNNPVNYVDPSGLAAQQAPAAVPPVSEMPGGTWTCAPQPTTQTSGKIVFEETFTHNGQQCTETCQIKIAANRCFHHSVAPGDSRDPTKWFNTFQVTFTRTNRKCPCENLPDYTMYVNGCQLWPGRLVNPSGPLSVAVMDYVKTLTSCSGFDLGQMCNAVQKVPPPETIPNG